MKRSRLVVAGWVLAVLGVIAALGAVSNNTAGSAPGVINVTGGAKVPSVMWYWTMAVSPTDPNGLVLGTSDGVYRSPDGGKTWPAQPNALKNVNVTSLADLGSTMFAGGVPVGNNPGGVSRTKTGYRAATDGPAVLASSDDGGATWKTLHPKGLANKTIQSLATDPSSNALYALLNDGKLYRSTDSGASFKLANRNIGIPPWAIAVTQGGQFVSGDMDAGPHTSTDGKTWQKTKFTDGRGGHMVMEYAVSPTDGTQVLMTSIGIVISTDGGKTWHPALKSSTMFGPVAYAPTAPQTAYAIGFDGTLWRSSDGGKTWTEVS